MSQVRVNLTIDEDVWKRFVNLVSRRDKSKIVNGLLKTKIAEMEFRREQAALASAFADAAKDPERRVVEREWESLDSEGWAG